MPAAGTRGDGLVFLDNPGLNESASLHAVGTVPGVAILMVGGANGPGVARIRCEGDGSRITWLAPGSSTWGEPCACESDGTYLIEDGEDAAKCARIQVATAYLPDGAAEARVLLVDVYNNAFSLNDISAGHAAAGWNTTYVFYLKANSDSDLLNVKCWIDEDAVDHLELSKTGAGYVSPDSEDHADVLTWEKIESGDSSNTIYVKHSVPAASPSDAKVLNMLHFSWDGY